MYQFDTRIRYSEVDMNGKLTLPALLNYFQDSSSFHSESEGVGVQFLKNRQCSWVLVSWQIVIKDMPAFCDTVTVQTWPYEFKRFLGGRNFCMQSESGEPLAWANTIWTYLDLQNGHPAKVSEEELQAYKLEEKFDMEYAPRKITVSGECEELPGFSVMRHHLDTNHHVNNVQYVQMAMDFLPEGFGIGQMRAEYRKEALLGNMIIPQVYLRENVCTVLLCDEEKNPYAVVEFTGKE